MNYARRQQYRRLSRAGVGGVGAVAALGVALALASVGAVSLAVALVLVALGFGARARHWLSLADRSKVGARSEDEVRRVLSALEVQGWRIRHSLRWHGRGDNDSVAIAPTGVAFAIETKTRTYDGRHLARVREQGVWLWRRRRRWCGQGAVPVLCVVRARGVQRREAGVLVVSIDWLTSALQSTARHHCYPWNTLRPGSR